ncbi:MAG: GNAT family N-acetyltransferase, partial [Chloroflexi bacterium]|nr:GNAT family N-acetyltransferase [Chloroflexota bacterium]
DHLGHLDRLGIHPSRQGLGYGADLLAFAIQRMASQGARRVGLSTQAENGRSQRLYEGFGFRRTGDSYQLYGLWLDHPGHQVRTQSSQEGGD